MSEKDKKKYPWSRIFRRKKERSGEIKGEQDPKKDKNEADIEEVYAGPGYFGGREEDPDDDPIAAVYDGPEYFESLDPPVEEAPEIMDPPIMMVYAGPEYFASRTKLSGDPGEKTDGGKNEGETVKEQDKDKKVKFCCACGMPIDASARICPECGEKQPGKDEEA